MTQQEIKKFEYWLTNNMYINKATADLIIQHCEQYFGTFKPPSLASNEERWIPVGEGLPEDTVEVLTASNEGPNDMPDWYFHVASIHGRKEWVTGTDTLYFVTHWRKLPSPPNQQLK